MPFRVISAAYDSLQKERSLTDISVIEARLQTDARTVFQQRNNRGKKYSP